MVAAKRPVCYGRSWKFIGFSQVASGFITVNGVAYPMLIMWLPLTNTIAIRWHDSLVFQCEEMALVDINDNK